MNPQLQDMKALLFMLPRIWKMEERVAGADLGLGKFQFDFDREEDIKEVMKMEPFHFDYWMLSLVRWSPVVDPSYPSVIKFWIRIIGVPLQYWADVSFRSIGKALGDVKSVNLDEGKVQVTTVNFDEGVETTIYLRYEKLFGYCRNCLSLCHDQQRCPLRTGTDEWKPQETGLETADRNQSVASYKTVTKDGGGGGRDSVKNESVNAGFKGKGKAHREEADHKLKGRSEKKTGEHSMVLTRPSGYIPPKVLHRTYKAKEFGNNGAEISEKELSSTVEVTRNQRKDFPEDKAITKVDHNIGNQTGLSQIRSLARKSLSFDEDDLMEEP
ncbi:hypothetical protein EUTSA_v10003335mg, partial [Eutrema salsugineum]